MPKGYASELSLCLSEGFDTFPTLLCAAGCCMIERRMGKGYLWFESLNELDGSTTGSWNSSNAKSLIRYTVNKGYIIYDWKLGVEEHLVDKILCPSYLQSGSKPFKDFKLFSKVLELRPMHELVKLEGLITMVITVGRSWLETCFGCLYRSFFDYKVCCPTSRRRRYVKAVI